MNPPLLQVSQVPSGCPEIAEAIIFRSISREFHMTASPKYFGRQAEGSSLRRSVSNAISEP